MQYEQHNGTTQINLLEVGFWRPSDGLEMLDHLFPHVEHGFRGRMLPLVSFHVRTRLATLVAVIYCAAIY